jgi:nitrite reductase/ring-hydroxylating ferredoxin subunit
MKAARPDSTRKDDMAKCDVCGNEYDKAFQVVMTGRTGTFDSFECAIHAMAPVCAHCRCRVVGHGVEAHGQIFCCVHCAKHAGVSGVADRV